MSGPDGLVGLLSLSVRAGPEQGSPSAVRASAERFTRAVLDRVADRVEARLPARVVLVRRLPVRWRIPAGALDDPATLERLAADLTAALLVHTGGETTPAEADDLAVFASEADWRAAHLDARASGGPAGLWYFAALDEDGDPLSALAVRPDAGLAPAVLRCLAGRGRLIAVLTSEPARSVEALARALGVVGDVRMGTEPAPSAGGPVPEALEAYTRSLPPDLPPAALGLLLYAQASEILDPYATTGDIVAYVRDASRCVRRTSVANDRARTDLPVTAAAASGSAVTPGSVYTTAFGGLFYLLNLALELGVGEALWAACLPEGVVLARAAALLLGAAGEGDVAPELFGGTSPRRPLPQVAPEQHAEVAGVLLDALVAAVPRRGLAAWPVVTLATADRPAGRVLVATAEGGPFVLFASPAPDAEAVRAGLATFLASWPPSAPPPIAEPGLAALDASGLVRAVRAGLDHPSPLLHDADSAGASALMAQVAGVLAFLFAARVDASDAAGFVERFLRVTARVILDDETLTVAIPAEAVDLRVRRAGLDRDPGRVPWLGRSVRFTYVGVEEV